MKPFNEWDRKGVLVVGAGVGLLLAVSLALVTGSLPKCWRILKSNPKNGPDSPIVVSGGSLNFFANNSMSTTSGSWQEVNNQDNLYQYNAGGGIVPGNLYLDSIYPLTNPRGVVPYPEQVTIPATDNWTITLKMRNKDNSGNPSNVYICTTLTSGSPQKCSTTPTGSLGSNPSFYIQGDPGTLNDTPIDRQNQHARIHYAVPNCNLSDPSDPKQICDKIDTIRIQRSSGDPVDYICVDGACHIKVY